MEICQTKAVVNEWELDEAIKLQFIYESYRSDSERQT